MLKSWTKKMAVILSLTLAVSAGGVVFATAAGADPSSFVDQGPCKAGGAEYTLVLGYLGGTSGELTAQVRTAAEKCGLLSAVLAHDTQLDKRNNAEWMTTCDVLKWFSKLTTVKQDNMGNAIRNNGELMYVELDTPPPTICLDATS